MATRETSSGDSVIATMGVEGSNPLDDFIASYGEPVDLRDNAPSQFPLIKAMYDAEPRVMVMVPETPWWGCLNGVSYIIPADVPVMVPLSVEGVLRNEREGTREVKAKNGALRRMMSYTSAEQVPEYVR